MLYEIQKFGVTVEWTQDLREAEESYKETQAGGVVFYRIEGSKKKVYRIK
jgi:hypothetical protein